MFDISGPDLSHDHRHAADQLLVSALRGERAAWDEIVSRYGRLVLDTAAGTGLRRCDAADAAQLTWLRLWRHGHEIRDPHRLAAWLVTTARREAIRLVAASRRYVLSPDPAEDHPGPSLAAAAHAPAAEDRWVIERAMDRLPVRYQTLLRLLSSGLALSYAEIADRMGLPLNSIGPMRVRAIRMLMKTPELTSASPL